MAGFNYGQGDSIQVQRVPRGTNTPQLIAMASQSPLGGALDKIIGYREADKAQAQKDALLAREISRQNVQDQRATEQYDRKKEQQTAEDAYKDVLAGGRKQAAWFDPGDKFRAEYAAMENSSLPEAEKNALYAKMADAASSTINANLNNADLLESNAEMYQRALNAAGANAPIKLIELTGAAKAAEDKARTNTIKSLSESISKQNKNITDSALKIAKEKSGGSSKGGSSWQDLSAKLKDEVSTWNAVGSDSSNVDRMLSSAARLKLNKDAVYAEADRLRTISGNPAELTEKQAKEAIINVANKSSKDNTYTGLLKDKIAQDESSNANLAKQLRYANMTPAERRAVTSKPIMADFLTKYGNTGVSEEAAPIQTSEVSNLLTVGGKTGKTGDTKKVEPVTPLINTKSKAPQSIASESVDTYDRWISDIDEQLKNKNLSPAEINNLKLSRASYIGGRAIAKGVDFGAQGFKSLMKSSYLGDNYNRRPDNKLTEENAEKYVNDLLTFDTSKFTNMFNSKPSTPNAPSNDNKSTALNTSSINLQESAKNNALYTTNKVTENLNTYLQPAIAKNVSAPEVIQIVTSGANYKDKYKALQALGISESTAQRIASGALDLMR